MAVGWAQDTLDIDSRRRLRPYELARKREGWVLLGYPTVGYDPLRSLGASLVASIAYNGNRNSPFFSYAPYKYYLFTQVGGFLRDSRYVRVFYDMPWIANRPYRVMLRLNFRDEAQGQFWGVGESYLTERLDPPSLSAYEKKLKAPSLTPAGTWSTRLAQHTFYIKQWQGWLIGERTAYRGLMRLMAGVRWTSERLTSLSGRTYTLSTPTGEKVSAQQHPTLIDSAAAGLVPLLPTVQVRLGSWQHRFFLGGAVVWDTRDFEINPTSGWLVELNHESRFPTFMTQRTTFSLRHYHILYSSPSEAFQLSGAWHGLFVAVYGREIPLTELQIYTRWADGRIPNLLSGPSTARAFRESRFVAPFVYLLQYELRSRIAEVRLLKQHFVGGPVAFIDVGMARDKFRLPSFRRSVIGGGMGVRILWNMTTVLRADAAYGREGWQLIFTTTHPF